VLISRPTGGYSLARHSSVRLPQLVQRATLYTAILTHLDDGDTDDVQKLYNGRTNAPPSTCLRLILDDDGVDEGKRPRGTSPESYRERRTNPADPRRCRHTKTSAEGGVDGKIRHACPVIESGNIRRRAALRRSGDLRRRCAGSCSDGGRAGRSR